MFVFDNILVAVCHQMLLFLSTLTTDIYIYISVVCVVPLELMIMMTYTPSHNVVE